MEKKRSVVDGVRTVSAKSFSCKKLQFRPKFRVLFQVSDEYIKGFIQANDTFLYQIVFDPKTRAFRPLHTYPVNCDDDFAHQMAFAGEITLEVPLQFEYALGNLDIRNYEVVGHFQPGSSQHGRDKKTRYGFPILHQKSIWDATYDPQQGFEIPTEETEAQKVRRPHTILT